MIIIVFRNIVNKLELPTDAVLGDTLIEITGKNTIYIENYRRIITFNDTYIAIQCKCYKLTICGKNLQILYYNNVDLKIVGVFDGITFC